MLTLAPNLKLPVELSGRRTAIFGISGSGKSNTATVLVEGLLAAGEQVVCIDPKGEAWGLLSTAAGKPSNLDLIIFGEPNGHIETLNESHGPKLADFVFESGRSVALSLLGFESDQSERRFVASFLRHLYRRKSRQAKKTRTLVVFEEAHLFVPESSGKGFKGEAAELAGAVQRIARQGRTFGLGSLFVDQRPQDVSKRVISQVDTIICHNLTHNTDRAALSEWVKGYDTDGRGKMFLDSLASLEPGEAWVWSPAWLKIFQRANIVRRKTFDSGAAPDDAATTKVQRAEIDLDKLRGQLTEIVEKAKAEDPKELRRQISELKRQLAYKQPAATDPAAIERAVSSAVALRDREWQAAVKDRERVVGDLKGRLGKIESLAHVNGEAAPKVQTPAKAALVAAPAASHSPPIRHSRVEPTGEPSDIGRGGLRRMLIALANRPQGLSASQLGVRAGLSSKSGTFTTYLSTARKASWIEGGRDRMRITDAGLSALGEYEQLPTGQELLAYWLGELGDSGAARMLRALADAYPRSLSKEELGEAAGLSQSGTFTTYLSTLRRLELIEGRGTVKASDELFEGA